MDPRIFACSLSFSLFSLIFTMVAAQGGGGVSVELWCVAKNNAEDSALQSALDWACGLGGADCGPIQKGGPCYDSLDLQRTASYAFNDYFLKHGLAIENETESCNFSNTAALTSLNPSHKNCKFPSSVSRGSGDFSGSVTGGAANADLSSSSSNPIGSQWNGGLIAFHLFLAIPLIL